MWYIFCKQFANIDNGLVYFLQKLPVECEFQMWKHQCKQRNSQQLRVLKCVYMEYVLGVSQNVQFAKYPAPFICAKPVSLWCPCMSFATHWRHLHSHMWHRNESGPAIHCHQYKFGDSGNIYEWIYVLCLTKMLENKLEYEGRRYVRITKCASS